MKDMNVKRACQKKNNTNKQKSSCEMDKSELHKEDSKWSLLRQRRVQNLIHV